MANEIQAQVKVSKKSRFSAIWIVPIVALLIGIYLIYNNYENKGLTIQILLESGDGLEAGKTKVKYKGVPIGEVTDINLDQKDNTVVVTALIDKDESYLVVEGTEFWVVKPRISAGKITGIGTIISGNYIQIKPGNGSRKTKFVALKEPPIGNMDLPGLYFTLISDVLGSLDPGSPIYYRKIKVGEIFNHKLEDDNKIYFRAYIEDKYQHLVTDKTRFWNISGITVETGLAGVKIQSESLATILEGGVAFDNPEGQQGKKAQNDAEFLVYKDQQSAMRMEGGLNIVFRVNKLGSLKPGAPVLYNELKVGEIEEHKLTPDGRKIDINAYIYSDYAHLVKTNSRFWNVSGIEIDTGLSGVKIKTQSIQTIIDGGIAFSNPQDSEGNNAKQGTIFMLYDSYESAFEPGREIMVTFKESKGLSPGNLVKFRGVDVGTVKSVELKDSMDGIVVKIRLIDEVEKLARSGSKFWVAEPEIGFGGLKNAGALLVKYIEVLPGYGTETYEFTGLESQPLIENDDENLKIVLLADRLSSVNQGVPVYYKQVEVGKVTGNKLSDNAENVEIYISIKREYAPLVRSNSKFWNVSGIGVDFYLFGVKAKTESLSSLIKGGIAFATPEKEMGNMVDSGSAFKLYESPEKKWLKWKPSINYKNSINNH